MKKILVVLILLLTTTLAQEIIGFLDLTELEQTKNMCFDLVLDALKNVSLPNFDIHDGSVHGNTFIITEGASPNVTVMPNENFGFYLFSDQIQASFHSANLTQRL